MKSHKASKPKSFPPAVLLNPSDPAAFSIRTRRANETLRREQSYAVAVAIEELQIPIDEHLRMRTRFTDPRGSLETASKGGRTL
jgi:hypothetical protein